MGIISFTALGRVQKTSAGFLSHLVQFLMFFKTSSGKMPQNHLAQVGSKLFKGKKKFMWVEANVEEAG